MDKPTQLIEFETMLLMRHHVLARPRPKRDAGERLDRSAYVLLSRLQLDGPMSIGQLREAFGLDTSTLNRQTAGLLRAGLAERIPDPDGGIARKFRITAEGERRLAADRTENVEGLEKVLKGWSAEEATRFAAMLHRFNEDIERLEGRPWPRP
ncbi:MarR family transcriptional regulator [Streptomyces sp. A7024]|uniref:MarR family transcriptional regulator n=1 Tax=Streptomyces coryli TaxID=1128680 RepID=A0A6G4UC17_9ACTN|nr:MarR family transcriptional regulator [Streptomyces coryli]NGN68877.1 MarR family transcriptional regulator [Streptomyces coryli]